MQVAYTNHIGRSSHASSKDKSTNIATAADLAAAEKHNNHDYEKDDVERMQSNINLDLKHHNRHFNDKLEEVGFNDLVATVKRIYQEEFKEEVDKYNDGQKRKDRRIKDYFDEVSADEKNDIAVEGIIQIGRRSDWEGRSVEERMKTLQIYLDVLKEMEKEIPGMKIAGADFHVNEDSPHLHWVCVPVDTSQKQRGLKNKRVGKSAVFTQDILGDVFQDKMRTYMERRMKEVWPDWEFEDKQAGRNKDLSKNEYANFQLQKENRELKEKNEALIRRISNLEQQSSYLESDIISKEKLQKDINDTIAGELEIIEKQLDYMEKRTDEIMELPELPERDEDLQFIVWCLERIKGVREAILAYCDKMYAKFLENVQNQKNERLEGIGDRLTSLDSKIKGIKNDLKAQNQSQKSTKPLIRDRNQLEQEIADQELCIRNLNRDIKTARTVLERQGLSEEEINDIMSKEIKLLADAKRRKADAKKELWKLEGKGGR